MCRILDQYKSEEVEQVVSNMEQTLRKMYEDAKTEGLIAGEVKGKKELIINMLAKNLDEKFISEISGFTIEEIRAIKKEVNKVLTT